jgi:hypothetical protein
MKRAGIIVALVLILAVPLRGQVNYPKAEVFGGYSFFHGSIDSIGHNWNGWGASVFATGTRYFGVAADFSGTYGSETFAIACPVIPPPVLPICPPQTENLSAYHVLGGPRFTRRSHDGTLFAHALFGAVDLRRAPPGNRTEFAMGFGGGVDVRLRKHLAYRIFQADYIPAKRSDGGWAHEFRVETGVVFTFGKR